MPPDICLCGGSIDDLISAAGAVEDTRQVTAQAIDVISRSFVLLPTAGQVWANASEVANYTPAGALNRSIMLISQATHVTNAARAIWDDALRVSNRAEHLAYRPEEFSSLIGTAERLAAAVMAQTTLTNNRVAEVVRQPAFDMGAPRLDVL